MGTQMFYAHACSGGGVDRANQHQLGYVKLQTCLSSPRRFGCAQRFPIALLLPCDAELADHYKPRYGGNYRRNMRWPPCLISSDAGGQKAVVRYTIPNMPDTFVAEVI